MNSILIVEDDITIHNNIKEALVEEQYMVESAYDGTIAERLIAKKKFQCIILDVNLPGKNGYEICSKLRSFDLATPVLMLTAFDELEDKVKGFESGVDDYLTKPFFMRELIIRIQTLIQRRNISNLDNTQQNELSFGDLVINLKNKEVKRQNQLITLTPREYQILLFLIQKKGDLVSKNELVKEIWGNIVDANTNTIEVYINFLRGKIDKPFNKQSIKTKVGYGYYIVSE
jgi:DNA-binding response OmpR family regulator